MTLFEFKSQKSVSSWQPEDDVVMGGVSNSELSYVQDAHENSVGHFSGKVSLENGGGFAQILYDKTGFDLTGFQGIELHVKGDNKTYELRFETDAERVSYAQSFVAKDEWHEVKLDFADFEPTFHGEAVVDAPALNLAAVRTVGFLIANEQAGTFSLLINEVKAY